MLSKEEILDLLEKMESKKPIYLQNLYRQYEVQLRQNKLLKQISFLNENSSTDEKEALKQIITQNEEYLDIFLSQTTEDTFQKVLSILNLSDEYKSLRKDRLFEKLSTYQQYDLDSVKDLFSLYCFQDIYFNVKLRLKTFLDFGKLSNTGFAFPLNSESTHVNPSKTNCNFLLASE